VDALRARGADVVSVNLTSDAQTKSHVRALCETPGEELAFAARWLRKTLESADGSMRIAVLLPDPEDERAAFETVLRETLAEELESIDTDLSSTPWEFAVGRPLRSLAMIADALDLARWTTGPLSQARISALLLSPYLNPGAERERAAQVDARLRRKERRLRPEMSLDGFVRLLDKHAYTLAWPRQLQIEMARGGEMARPRSYATWMEFVRGVVQATGWPSSQARALNATEYEASRAWDSVLDTVATLDFAGRRVSLDTAIEALERQVKTMSFQPPSTNAAVQILRPEQTEGGVFDAVLFLHATDQNLPAPEWTHPLLSLALQSQMQMPGTDSARAAKRVRASVASLLERTPNVLFLCAKEDENGALRSSPLLAELRLEQVTVDEPAQQHIPLECERFADDAPLPPLLTLEVHGGARVLQLQAACGFRAFAELRLGAGEPEETGIGLDARQSGGLIHKVLELLWQPRDGEMRMQRHLAEMSEAERRAVLERHIDEALRSESSAPEAQWDAAYLSVVRERLLMLMSKWLEHELQRGPFTVLGVEHNETIPVGPLHLKVRVDRIDQVVSADEGGECAYGSVLIDYKTGSSAHPNQWEGERPEEPQLPLYTQLLRTEENVPLMGMAFGKVIAGDAMRWHGLQGATGLLPKAATVDLVQRIEEWGETLERLAHAFADGEADVAPKDPVKTCKHCGLQVLCRVGELTLMNDESDDEEAGDE
jgi:ATP-dependent helicase/nuclease subunit B